MTQDEEYEEYMKLCKRYKETPLLHFHLNDGQYYNEPDSLHKKYIMNLFLRESIQTLENNIKSHRNIING